MSDLKTMVVAVVAGRDVTLHDALYTLKLRGRLGEVVAQTVTDRLIADAAARAGVNVAADEVQKAADAFRQARGLNRADDTRSWLDRHQLSREDLEVGLRRAILFDKMMHRIAPAERVEQYFADQRARFDQARLSRLDVPNEDLARELLAQLQEDGADFAETVRKHDSDRLSQETGGRLGIISRKRLPPAIELAVFSAATGDVVGPFQNGQSFLLVKVEEILPARLTSQIRELLRRELFSHWLREQAIASAVEIRLQQNV